jgi:hypothetical protein
MPSEEHQLQILNQSFLNFLSPKFFFFFFLVTFLVLSLGLFFFSFWHFFVNSYCYLLLHGDYNNLGVLNRVKRLNPVSLTVKQGKICFMKIEVPKT